MSYVFMAIAGIVSGILGAMGLGGGGILIIYLTLIEGVEQVKAGGINLIFFIPSAVIAVIYYSRRKMIEWSMALPSMFFGVVGGIGGAYLSTVLDGFVVGKLFGILLLIMGIQQLLYKKNGS